jgi:hypothetical protein
MDGSEICVADRGNGRASVFRVGDGGLVQHIGTGLSLPYDVEEVVGGWLVACFGTNSVVFVGDGVGGDGIGGNGGGRPSLCKAGSWDVLFSGPTALAALPCVGLVVRDLGDEGRVQLFATPDAIAMASMSPCRVAFMGAVARAVQQLHRPQGSVAPK